MATKPTSVSPTPALARRLREHREEVARLRARYGDPGEALTAFMREHFSEQALARTYREQEAERSAWLAEAAHGADER